MITKNSCASQVRGKKSKLNMLHKMSIVPVALVAMYLFACNSETRPTQAEEKSAIVSETGEIHLFAKVDEKPLFAGKDVEVGLREYVINNINYPPTAAEHGISGKVFVEFVIDTDGYLKNVSILRGVDPLLDNEALRVIKASPQWTPGKHGGKKVAVMYQFPINFQISDGAASSSERSIPNGAASSSERSIPRGLEEVFMYALVDEKPTFNGMDAEKGFREYVSKNITYPAEAMEKGITGRVFVEFTIGRDGSVSNVTLLRGVDPLLDKESLRLIAASPKWTPGKHRGKEVNVKYQFPINFQLNN